MIGGALGKAFSFAAMVIACVCLMIFARGYEMYESTLENISPAQMSKALINEDFTSVDELPDFYIEAVICTEDRVFLKHNGIDYLAKLRAILHDVSTLSFDQGGSTITEQLAKNFYFSQEKKLERKVAESFAALDIEDALTKREIFELYVNSIYFGQQRYGIRAAARGFFGKEPSELNEFECAMLAGLPNAPSVYSCDEELALQRTRIVLENMAECGVIADEDIESIMSMRTNQ